MQYPTVKPNHPISPIHNTGLEGLTKREYYAGLALQGLLAGFDPIAQKRDLDYSEAADEAVSFADALIAQLSKGGES